jgi:hypothetical protein
MKRTILLCVLLAGCATTPQQPSLWPIIESACASVAFAEYGNCLSARSDEASPDWRSMSGAPLLAVYISWLQEAGQKVSAGHVPESEARAGMIRFRTDIHEIFELAQYDRAGARMKLEFLHPPILSSAGPANSGSNCTSIDLGGGVIDTACH